MNFKQAVHVGGFTECDENKKGVCKAPGHWETQALYVPDTVVNFVVERMKAGVFTLADLERSIPNEFRSDSGSSWIAQLAQLYSRRKLIQKEGGRQDQTTYKWCKPIQFFGMEG